MKVGRMNAIASVGTEIGGDTIPLSFDFDDMEYDIETGVKFDTA